MESGQSNYIDWNQLFVDEQDVQTFEHLSGEAIQMTVENDLSTFNAIKLVVNESNYQSMDLLKRLKRLLLLNFFIILDRTKMYKRVRKHKSDQSGFRFDTQVLLWIYKNRDYFKYNRENNGDTLFSPEYINLEQVNVPQFSRMKMDTEHENAVIYAEKETESFFENYISINLYELDKEYAQSNTYNPTALPYQSYIIVFDKITKTLNVTFQNNSMTFENMDDSSMEYKDLIWTCYVLTLINAVESHAYANIDTNVPVRILFDNRKIQYEMLTPIIEDFRMIEFSNVKTLVHVETLSRSISYNRPQLITFNNKLIRENYSLNT